MQNKTVFGHWDATFVAVNAIIVKLIYYFLNIFTLISARGGLICSLVISLLFILISVFYSKIYGKIKDADFGNISERAFGRIFKKISYILYSVCFVVNTGMVLTFYTASVMNMLLPLSSVKVLLVLIMATAFIISGFGFKTIVRIHGIFTPALLLVMLVANGAMLTKCNINNFFPILGYGTGSVFYCVLFTFSYFYEIIFMLFMMPSLAKEEERKKTIKLTCIFTVLILIVSVTAYIGSVPFPANTNILSVLMFIANSMNFATPLKEILLVFMIAYTINVIMYVATNLYFSSKLLSEVVNTTQEKPIRIATSLLIATSSVISGTVANATDIYKYIQPFLWVAGIVIPALVLIKGCKNEKN